MRRLLVILLILLLLAALVVMIGCGKEETWTPTSADIEEDSSQETAPTGEMSTYESTEYGFTISYPEEWFVDEQENENGALIGFSEPVVGPSGEYAGSAAVSVVIPVPPFTPESLEQYVDYQVGLIEEAAPDYEMSDTTLDGYEAKQLTYTIPEQDSEVLQIVTLKDGEVYFLLCQAPIQYFDDYLETFEMMIDSFAFL